LTLALFLATVTNGLLMFMGVALLGLNPSSREDPALSCTAFQVGSPDTAFTHLHLENVGPDITGVRLNFDTDYGLTLWPLDSALRMQPWATEDVLFETPALGTVVTLIFSGEDLRASAEILRDDGSPPEIRKAIQCLANSVLPPDS
jgi:hypothetical protein